MWSITRPWRKRPASRSGRTCCSARASIRELAKRIVKEVKGSKLKVQVSIQGDELRVTGKKRDDLQAAIQFVKGLGIEQPLQFENFRD